MAASASVSQLRITADEVERTFTSNRCLLEIHTRRECHCNGTLEEHLHWSSPLATTTVDVYVSSDGLRATWTGAVEWLSLSHHQVDVLVPTIIKTGRLIFADRAARGSHLVNLDPLSLGEILNRLDFSDVRSLLQTGSKQLVKHMSASTNVYRIDAKTREEVACLLDSSLLRRVLPSVRAVRICKPFMAKYGAVMGMCNLPRALVSLDLSPYGIVRFSDKDVAKPFLSLATLSLGSLKAPLPLEVFMPSLTSLNIQTEGGLECDVATALPSMLHEFSVCAGGWKGLIDLIGDETWPSLHTLTIKYSYSTECSLKMSPNATRCPSLTRLVLDGVRFADDFNLDALSGLNCLEHLTIETYQPSLVPILENSTRPLPPRLTSIEINTLCDQMFGFQSVSTHLMRLLPPSIEKIMSRSTEHHAPSVNELLALPNLTRIHLHSNELVRCVINGAPKWESFCALAQKPNVEAREFDRFEILHSRVPAESNRAVSSADFPPHYTDRLFFKALSNLMCNCPALGVTMASRYPSSLEYQHLARFSVPALYQWLKHATSSCFDFTFVPVWVSLLRYLAYALLPERIVDVLGHHSKYTHPIMFRFLLHLVFIVAVKSGDQTTRAALLLSDSTSACIISHLSSQYGYNNELQHAASCLTMSSIKRMALHDTWLDHNHKSYENLIEMLERPSWAELCCKGDVDSAWFDDQPAWRTAALVRDLLISAIRDKRTSEDEVEAQTCPITTVVSHNTVIGIYIKLLRRHTEDTPRIRIVTGDCISCSVTVTDLDMKEYRFSCVNGTLSESRKVAAAAVRVALQNIN